MQPGVTMAASARPLCIFRGDLHDIVGPDGKCIESGRWLPSALLRHVTRTTPNHSQRHTLAGVLHTRTRIKPTRSCVRTQLGGPRVMGVNGVSHHLVADDLEGAATMLRLLAFCPPELGAGTGACVLGACVFCGVGPCASDVPLASSSVAPTCSLVHPSRLHQ